MARARTLWEEGREPARPVMVLGAAIAISLMLANLLLTRQLGWLFDVGFVALCVFLALRVRPADFLLLAVYPPLLMLGVLLLHAIFRSSEGAAQGLVTGLTEHAGALAAGYALFLVCLVIRQRFVDRRGTTG